jgi:hypothetical protein
MEGADVVGVFMKLLLEFEPKQIATAVDALRSDAFKTLNKKGRSPHVKFG